MEHFGRILRNIVTPLALAVISSTTSLIAPAAADEVTLPHNGLTLNASLTVADGKALADGVVLITHGTLAHNGMEVIAAMQKLLAERGRNTLAINLSLGLDNRHGMYDCAVPHKHHHTDALDEIGAWIGWLKGKGAQKIALMGHSRGGNQTAWFAAERPDPAVGKVVLLAPATWNEAEDKASYKARFGSPVEVPLQRAEALIAAGKGGEMMEQTGFVYCKDASVAASAFVSYHKPEARMDTPGLLAKLSVPVLVVAASKDEVVKGLVEAVEPLADGDKVSLKVIDDADHFFRDFAAEDAADAIDAFLKK